MAYITKKQTNSGVKPIGSNLFGSCSTASGTVAKVVTMPDFDVLVEGVTIHVHFDNGNTASSPTLKVGSTDAKPIVGTWDASGVYSLTYHSGSWYLNDNQSGGGGGHTYGLSINGTTLQIVEDGGSPSVTIPDDDTTYTISINGRTITLTPSSGTPQSVTVPDENTTYTLTKSGNTITLTGSDGSTASVTDENTTYGLSFSNGVLSLVPSGNTPSVTLPDEDTTYTISINDHTITLTPSSGTAQTITIPDDDTTYTITISGDVITLTGSDGSTSTVTVPNNSLRYVADVVNSPETYGVVINDVTGNVASGNNATAQGSLTTASALASHAEGFRSVASGYASHAEGRNTIASGYGSHAEGQPSGHAGVTYNTTASGAGSHAEGLGTLASGAGSHAEGDETEASGYYSHAEGEYSKASGNVSHAGGYETIASRFSQTVVGRYNVQDGSNPASYGTYAVIIGNGTDDNRSNALAVKWNGDLLIKGDVYVGCNSDSTGGSLLGKVTGVKGNSESSYRTGDVNLTPANIGAVPTTRKVNNKALSADITLSASDVGALASDDLYTRSSVGGCDWSTATANMVIAKSALAFWNGSYDGAASNLQRLNATVYIGGTQMKDFVKEQGASSSWYYRKWNSGKIEAWRTYNAGSQTPALWVTGWYYKDLDVAIPSGIFSSAPNTTIATNNGSDYQYMVHTARATSATNIRVRVVKPNSGGATPVIALYVCNMV